MFLGGISLGQVTAGLHCTVDIMKRQCHKGAIHQWQAYLDRGISRETIVKTRTMHGVLGHRGPPLSCAGLPKTEVCLFLIVVGGTLRNDGRS